MDNAASPPESRELNSDSARGLITSMPKLSRICIEASWIVSTWSAESICIGG